MTIDSALPPLAIASVEAETLAEVVTTNLGLGGLSSPFGLERVKLPAGGSLVWTIPGLEEDRMSKQLDGVIVHQRPGRAWWQTTLEESGGGTPPDCRSDDGIVGSNRSLTKDATQPLCSRCPYNEWGSGARGGRGKACRELRLLFLLPADGWLPLLFVAPPTSLQALQRYLQRLTAAARPYWSVRTRVELERVTGAGPAYSRTVFKLLGYLSSDEFAAVRAYRSGLVSYLDAVSVSTQELAAE